jgi:hypothetical protein
LQPEAAIEVEALRFGHHKAQVKKNEGVASYRRQQRHF